MKRTRADDAEADEIERETGKHVFRKAIKPEDEEAKKENAGLTPEEIARKKKQKRKDEKKAISRLTFEEDDI